MARLLLVFAVLTLAVSSAFGSMITLTDGIIAINVSDNGVGDSNATAGVITYSGPVGADFSINVTTGITKPVLGNARMDLNSVDLTLTAGAKTLQLFFSENGFTNAWGPPMTFRMDIGGTTPLGTTLTYAAYMDVADAIYPTAPGLPLTPGTPPGTLINSASFVGATSFSATKYGVAAIDDSFALTQAVSIAMSGPGTVSFDASLQPVPEPVSLVLVGTGLLVISTLFRRRFVK